MTTKARTISTNLTGDEIKAIIDSEQSKYAAADNMDAYMALARVLRVIAAQEVEQSINGRKASVARKPRAKTQADVWPPVGC